MKIKLPHLFVSFLLGDILYLTLEDIKGYLADIKIRNQVQLIACF